MRVYFAPCGIGLGHVGRIIPIARKLMEKEADVIFSTYREGIQYVSHEKLPFFKAPSIGFKVKPDGTVDFRQTAANPGPFFASFTLIKQVNAEITAIRKFNPDIVVSDSRISPLLAARALRIPRICILNQFQVVIPRKKRFLRLARFADSATLAIIGKMWTSGNTVLIPDYPQPYTISVGNLNIPKSYRKNVKLIGPILSPQPDELPTQKELRIKLGLPEDKPIIFAPISGPIREKTFLTKILKRILLKIPDDYEVVLSLGHPCADTKPVRRDHLRIHKWISNRFEYLKACDLVISRAGHGTLTQCIHYGKPMVLVPTPSHTEQILNAEKVERLGVAKVIAQQNLNRTRLLKTVQQMLAAEVSERAMQIQTEICEYDGLENSVKAILEKT